METTFMSEYISDFLDFITAVPSSMSMSESDLADTNAELQDLEHYIELEKYNAAQGAKVLKAIREVRKRRRNAKTNIEICQPINQRRLFSP